MKLINRRRLIVAVVISLSLGAGMVGCTPSGNTGSTPGQSTGSTTANNSPNAMGGSPHAMTMTPGADHSHTPGESAHGHASASPGMDHKMGSKSMEALSGLSGKDFDIAFMSQMIAHHQGAIDMSKQTLAVAKLPETKAEAQKVIDAQTAEIAQMTGWLKDWYGVEPSADQEALMKDDMKSMMAMPITEDKMFYQMMIPHHEGAIMMAEMVGTKSEKPELKEMAKEIVAAQQAEIQQYQQMMAK